MKVGKAEATVRRAETPRVGGRLAPAAPGFPPGKRPRNRNGFCLCASHSVPPGDQAPGTVPESKTKAQPPRTHLLAGETKSPKTMIMQAQGMVTHSDSATKKTKRMTEHDPEARVQKGLAPEEHLSWNSEVSRSSPLEAVSEQPAKDRGSAEARGCGRGGQKRGAGGQRVPEGRQGRQGSFRPGRSR